MLPTTARAARAITSSSLVGTTITAVSYTHLDVYKRQAAQAEQALFGRFLTAFGFSEDAFRPHFETIALKNDKSVFLSLIHI